MSRSSNCSEEGCTAHSTQGYLVQTQEPYVILRTPTSAAVSANYIGHMEGWLITEKDVQESVEIVSPSEHVHRKFFPILPVIWFQCLHYLDLVCMMFQATAESFLHGCMGNLKFSTSTTDEFHKAMLKSLVASVDDVSVYRRHTCNLLMQDVACLLKLFQLALMDGSPHSTQ